MCAPITSPVISELSYTLSVPDCMFIVVYRPRLHVVYRSDCTHCVSYRPRLGGITSMCVCVCFSEILLKENETVIFSVIVLRVKQWLFWYRNHACTTTASETRAARRSATMLSSASTGGRHFLTISLDTVGYGEQEFQRQLSASRLLLCFFWSCVSKFNGTLYSHCPSPYVTTLQYREIFWQNGSLLYGSDTAKQQFFMRLQLRLQSLHKHDFISNQLFLNTVN